MVRARKSLTVIPANLPLESATSRATSIAAPSAGTRSGAPSDPSRKRHPRKFFTSSTLSITPLSATKGAATDVAAAAAVAPQRGSSPAPKVPSETILEALNAEGAAEKEGRALRKKVAKAEAKRVELETTAVVSAEMVDDAMTTTGVAARKTKNVVFRALKSGRRASAKHVAAQTLTLPSPPPSDEEDGVAAGARAEDGEVPVPGAEVKKEKRITKPYMASGLYCQYDDPKPAQMLVNRVLQARSEEAKTEKAEKVSIKAKTPPLKVKPRASEPVRQSTRTRGRASLPGSSTESKTSSEQEDEAITALDIKKHRLTFPPLPYDFGYDLFFGKEHDFELPYNIRVDAERGLLDGKKKPAHFQKIRSNVFYERSKMTSDVKAICRCDPSSGCGETCINRVMSYLCGKDCPCGDECTNKSLHRRKGPGYKVTYMGARGFGLVLTEDVKEGDFVLDYRGEIISIETFHERIESTYKAVQNFYALEYDQHEVIDAGLRGNDARFINHGCAPNLEVRKCQTLGDGWEEFEVGMWAARDIKKGEELFYDYNFEHFAPQPAERHTRCACGASNCSGYLGRRPANFQESSERGTLHMKPGLGIKKKKKTAVKASKGGDACSATPTLIPSDIGSEESQLLTPAIPDTLPPPAVAVASTSQPSSSSPSAPTVAAPALAAPLASKSNKRKEISTLSEEQPASAKKSCPSHPSIPKITLTFKNASRKTALGGEKSAVAPKKKSAPLFVPPKKSKLSGSGSTVIGGRSLRGRASVGAIEVAVDAVAENGDVQM